MNWLIDWAPKKSVWWIQSKETLDKPNQRCDMLIAFNRVYVREYKKYLYQLVIGRFCFMFTFQR